MAKKRAKSAEEIADWAELDQEQRKRFLLVMGLNSPKTRAWQLRRLGWTIAQVAQVLSVGVSTVKRWDTQMKEEFGDLPTVQCAKDAIQTLLPKAIAVAERSLDSTDERIAWDASKTLLNSFEVLVEKTQDTKGADDSELIAQAERIIAVAKRRSEVAGNSL